MNRLQIIAITVAMTLAACDSKNVKPLIGGIKNAAETKEKVSGNEDYNRTFDSRNNSFDSRNGSFDAQDGNDKSEKETGRQGKGLEIPAPLNNVPEQILRRTGYTTSYNKETRLPNWVAWCLTGEHTQGSYKRQGKDFHEDEEVPTPRAVDWDYYNSGYDRGHMCPAGDNKWNADAMWESFLFTNICPQNPNLNRGDWNEMENQCRRWAKKYGEVYIVCGPVLFKQKHKTIGKNKVVVPEAFFKVVLRMSPEPKAIGFIYRNTDGNRPKDAYVNSVDEVERITGMDFFPTLPDDIENRIEAERDLSGF